MFRFFEYNYDNTQPILMAVQLIYRIEKNTVRTPIVDPFPIEDPSLKIHIEDPFYLVKSGS